jgi:hypothetical protein
MAGEILEVAPAHLHLRSGNFPANPGRRRNFRPVFQNSPGNFSNYPGNSRISPLFLRGFIGFFSFVFNHLRLKSGFFKKALAGIVGPVL